MTKKEAEWLERCRARKTREEELRKFALTLLEQCESERLTIYEFHQVLELMRTYCEGNVVIQGLREI